jgi:hypothetical protein
MVWGAITSAGQTRRNTMHQASDIPPQKIEKSIKSKVASEKAALFWS